MQKDSIEVMLPKSGGYRKTKTFQKSRLLYDITLRFCDLYVPLTSRTHDQRVQAARSGVQNLAEGRAASGTSKKMERNLTGVAWASLGELELDFEDYPRHWGLPPWTPGHPILARFKQNRSHSLEDFRKGIATEIQRPEALSGGPCPSKSVHVRPCPPRLDGSPTRPDAYAANGVLSLLNLDRFWILRQLGAQGERFLQEGGFTERLYKLRTRGHKRQWQ